MESVLLASCLLLLAVTEAAILPIDSSLVNVQRTGQDYSYSIQENHCVAIETPAAAIPVLKTAPVENAVASIHLQEDKGQEQKQHHQIKSISIPTMTYSVPFAAIPAYVPSFHYGVPYGVNYPYSLVGVA